MFMLNFAYVKEKIPFVSFYMNFYDSTYSIILNDLYSKVNKKGCLINDDYHHLKDNYKA